VNQCFITKLFKLIIIDLHFVSSTVGRKEERRKEASRLQKKKDCRKVAKECDHAEARTRGLIGVNDV
jgi:hypothetical protein